MRFMPAIGCRRLQIISSAAFAAFFLNKYFTFRSKRLNVKEALRFVLCIAFCYAVSYGIARPAIRLLFSPYAKQIQDNAAMVLGSIVFTAMNFFGQKYVVFKK